MKTSRLLRASMLGIATLACLKAAFAGPDYSFTRIDALNYARGINNNGQIVGRTPSGAAFLYTGGVLTTLPVPPSAFGAEAFGINNSGQIVGAIFNEPALTSAHGFLDIGGTISTIDVPGARGTEAWDINDAGQIVGRFTDGNRVHGFLYTDGIFTVIDVPGALATNARGINNRGQIVGSTQDHGFLFDVDGTFTAIDAPGVHTQPFGINDAGQIVGYFMDTGEQFHGFVDTDGTFTLLDVPGAAGVTEAFDINDMGHIVGFFDDQSGRHSFLATPVTAVPEPPTLLLLTGGLVGWFAFTHRRNLRSVTRTRSPHFRIAAPY